jgi:hypothetical protein
MSAFAISRSASRPRATVNSMFDCPEHNQTSPTSTSVAVSTVADDGGPTVTVSVRGTDEASSGSRRTIQRPSGAAVAAFSWPANRTRTVVPGSAQPQTGAATPRCRTAWSENRGWSCGLPGPRA